MANRNTQDLAQKRCLPCEGGVEACSFEQSAGFLKQLQGWELSEDGKRIRKDWKLKNFMEGIRFFEKVAKIAEEEMHHPDLHLEGYRHVWMEIWTHAIGGLSENDFILAAKIDAAT